MRPNVVVVVAAIAMLVAGCATRPAPDITGRWKAVNRYAETAQEIPLYQSYVFYPSPMDGTLKNMLSRWAKDSGMTLSYLHPSDFTLFAPVDQVRTASLQEAASLLSSIYALQQVEVAVEGNQILVRKPAAPSAPASGGPATATSGK